MVPIAAESTGENQLVFRQLEEINENGSTQGVACRIAIGFRG